MLVAVDVVIFDWFVKSGDVVAEPSRPPFEVGETEELLVLVGVIAAAVVTSSETVIASSVLDCILVLVIESVVLSV